MGHEQVIPIWQINKISHELIRQIRISELRQRLNREIELNNYSLTAPDVLNLSQELDSFITEYYQEYWPLPLAQ